VQLRLVQFGAILGRLQIEIGGWASFGDRQGKCGLAGLPWAEQYDGSLPGEGALNLCLITAFQHYCIFNI
ncbi:MAG: hypothetical protein KIT37_13520, partial [Steroidobacteraceae bacterium]|nr:hypothetical protein [Steroidobacteraceae bacterium]